MAFTNNMFEGTFRNGQESVTVTVPAVTPGEAEEKIKHIYQVDYVYNIEKASSAQSYRSTGSMGFGGLLFMAGAFVVIGLGVNLFSGNTPSVPTNNNRPQVESTYVPQSTPSQVAPSYSDGPCVTANFEPC